MKNINDPRAKRTRQLIQYAFGELLQKKEFDSITIADITQKATLNRATFYAHYDDKYMLLEEIVEMAFKEMLSEQVADAERLDHKVCSQLVSATYDYIVAFYDTCKFNAKSLAGLVDEKVKAILQQTIVQILVKDKEIKNPEVNASMMSAIIYNGSFEWRKKQPQNLDELVSLVENFNMQQLIKESK